VARSKISDFAQLFQFQVVEPRGFLNPVAGFTSCSIPDFSLPEVTYREGMYTYTRKQPGIPEFGNVVLRRGVARTPTDFFNWILGAVEGREYRTDIEIQHFLRGDTKAPMATYQCLEALVVRVKATDDLDANAPDVAMEELEFAFESMNMSREAGAGGTPQPTPTLTGAGTVIRQSGR